MTLRILGTLAMAVALSVGLSAAQTKAAKASTGSATGVVTSVSPGSLAIEASGKKTMIDNQGSVTSPLQEMEDESHDAQREEQGVGSHEPRLEQP